MIKITFLKRNYFFYDSFVTCLSPCDTIVKRCRDRKRERKREREKKRKSEREREREVKITLIILKLKETLDGNIQKKKKKNRTCRIYYSSIHKTGNNNFILPVVSIKKFSDYFLRQS